MESNMIQIGFSLVDELGHEYSAQSKFEVCESLGETPLDAIGIQLNAFLKQCGYSRKNDYIFMKDISDEEYDAIADFLSDYRENKEN